MTILTFNEPLRVVSADSLRLLAERFGGTLTFGSETQRKVRYYVHRSELARIASNFYRYVHAERRLR